MPSRAEILDPEREHPFTVTASSGDRRTSVSSSVIRCIYDGQRAVAIGDDASAKTQIALLDLLHLHYDGADEATPSVTNRDEVTIILETARTRPSTPFAPCETTSSAHLG